ncbi:hypothetical protein CDN99_05830 [Roseateles aquatilis]|uniref:Uncharacterized protein n=1 Tax=Roseateles aquatilis TaxID=431061 RepID=A0A246JGV9_9BURK|nr:hypothetical protein CDN99_05830 [Roseateles aquatilis]
MWKAAVLNEWRLRSRRVSTLVILLTVVAVSWLMVLDPRTGRATMVTGGQRIAYDSQALAFATGVMACMLFGLAGFYLARGRSQEDLRCGTAAVLAATPVTNVQLLGARWLGAFGFLMSLGTALMLTLWVLQLVRGEGPLRPVPYLQMLLLGLAPGMMMCASLAVLADAWAPLMRKRGDALYWVFWIAQLGFMPAMLSGGASGLSGWQVLDVQGLSVWVVALSRLMDVGSVSIGGAPFRAGLPVLHMPEGLWSRELVALRVGAMGVALLPLLPAVLLFHRYAPDRVKGAGAGRGRAVAVLQWLSRPVLAPMRWLFGQLLGLSARVPGLAGRLLADVSLVLLSQPVLALVMTACVAASVAVPTSALPRVMALALGAWGIAVADVSSRDWQSGTLGMASATAGGAPERGWRQAVAAFGLGVIVGAPALLRLSVEAPLRAAACLAGLLFFSAGAALLGRLTRGARTFLALYLFSLYLGLQRTGIAALDMLGVSGAATAGSVAAYAAAGGLGVLALAAMPRMARGISGISDVSRLIGTTPR